MEFLQKALLILLVCWVLQIVATWIQWKHYRTALTDDTEKWNDGFLGVGQSKPRFARGAVAILSVTSDLRVRELRTMCGITVFARFKSNASVRDWTVAQLATHYAPGTRHNALAKAICQAIAQIEEVRRQQT